MNTDTPAPGIAEPVTHFADATFLQVSAMPYLGKALMLIGELVDTCVIRPDPELKISWSSDITVGVCIIANFLKEHETDI
jgi:hypothetical protein